MATITRGPKDEMVCNVREALDASEAAHPGSKAELYRYNPGSIRVRIIDERFKKMARFRRHDETSDFLEEHAGDDPMMEVSLLLTLAPSEQKMSIMDDEFDDPTVMEPLSAE